MRLKLLMKNSAANVVYGIAENEKSYKRAIITLKEGDAEYKLLSLSASKDGSLSVFFNYCKDKSAFVFRHRHTYKPGSQRIDASRLTGEYEVKFGVDRHAKLSLHQSGFVQLSGKGIKSGIDPQTGEPRGVGVFSNPLATPVRSGPTFGGLFWGVSEGFEKLAEKKSGVQYISYDKGSSEFMLKPTGIKGEPNSYHFEFFIFPPEASDYVYEHRGEVFIDHTFHNYRHKPGIRLALHVVDLKHFPGVIAIFPGKMCVGLSKKQPFGFTLGGPGGTNSASDKSGNTYLFNVISPGDRSNSIQKNKDGVLSLDFNAF